MGVPAVSTYRAMPISQRDGSLLASSNCRMAAIATGLDYETAGAQLSNGAEMRARQDDQSGGTDSGDAAQAWRTYGPELRIRDGATFDDALEDLQDGRLVHLDVWHAAAAGPCVSGSGLYGHSIAVAPESSGSRWLTADPWCSPARWVWWETDLLRAGAETWGGQVYTAATTGRPRPSESVLLALMRIAAKRLMTTYRPTVPAPATLPDTGGSGGRILFTTTGSPELEVRDMPINAADGLRTNLRAAVPAGLPFYADPDLRSKLGSMSASADVVYVGNPVGETVAGGSRAVLVNTSTAYNDGSTRPTIVYVAASAIDPYSLPPDQDDLTTAIDERDAEWREWLLDGSPTI